MTSPFRGRSQGEAQADSAVRPDGGHVPERGLERPFLRLDPCPLGQRETGLWSLLICC